VCVVVMGCFLMVWDVAAVGVQVKMVLALVLVFVGMDG